MKREILRLSTEEAANIIWEDTFEFKVILDNIEFTSRWSSNHYLVIQRIIDGKYFESRIF